MHSIKLCPLTAESELAIQRMQETSHTCLELWNTCIEQRSNKYSWGKADKNSQIREIKDIHSQITEYQLIPLHTLYNIVEQVDQQYQYFFQRLHQFKTRQSPKKPVPPSKLNHADSIALSYLPSDYQQKGNTLLLRTQNQWLTFTLPKGIELNNNLKIYCKSNHQIEFEIMPKTYKTDTETP